MRRDPKDDARSSKEGAKEEVGGESYGPDGGNEELSSLNEG